MAFLKSLFVVAPLVVSLVKCAPTNLRDRRDLEVVPDFVLKYGMRSKLALRQAIHALERRRMTDRLQPPSSTYTLRTSTCLPTLKSSSTTPLLA